MAILWLIALFAILIAAGTAAWAAVSAAPFVPTWRRDVGRMLSLAEVKPDELVLDLGAGDGRYLVAAVKNHQARAIGYEITLLAWLAAWLRLRFSGTAGRAKILYRDFFRQDLSSADVVLCFLTPRAMAKLGPKLKRELKPGTRVLSYAFAIPGWTPVKKDKPEPGRMAVWVYRV